MNQYGYGGMGMYNMNTTNGGFASMPPGQFPLGAPLGQQPQPTAAKPSNPRSGSSPALQQPQGYPPETTDSQPATNPNMPPNNVNPMPGMQGYPNPAFLYGQYNQMTHPYQMQYGYAPNQGQFNQGGFGYHQVMSGGGYGAPYGHDGRQHQDDHHSHGRDPHYNKGGYRHNNRNNHQGGHSNYGNNYQGGNYGGGGPYGNNYQGQYGEFQRGGYGGNNDPYGMPQGGPSYNPGYPDNEGKGKANKGPHRVQQGFHSQPVGLRIRTNRAEGGGLLRVLRGRVGVGIGSRRIERY
jgi:hypothetical protein